MKIIVSEVKILKILILLMPFIDIFLGVLLNNGISGPLAGVGQLYRGILFLYLLVVTYRKKIGKSELCLLCFICWVFIVPMINAYRFHSSPIDNVSISAKFLLPILLITYLINNKRISSDFIKTIFDYFEWVYPLSLIVPKILDIGYEHYGNASGYQGLYFGTNEINIILVVLFVYSFDKLYSRFSMKQLVCVMLNVGALLLIGSKTSLMVLPIVFSVFLFRGRDIKKKIEYLAAMLTIGTVAGGAIVYMLGDRLQRVQERLMFFYNMEVNSSYTLFTFMCSGRNLRIDAAIDYWYSKNKAMNILIGVGKSAKCPDTELIEPSNPFSLIEMDFFDGLFWMGLIVILIIFIAYIGLMIKTFRNKRVLAQKLMLYLMIAFSLLAGHVMFSASSGLVFGLVVSYLFLKDLETKGDRRAIRNC